LIDLDSKELRHKLIVEGGNLVSVNGALALAFSPDSSLLAMADLSGLVTLWDVASGDLLKTFAAGELAIDLAFSPDGQWIAMTGEKHLLLFER
jgi:WD40 repeat protein